MRYDNVSLYGIHSRTERQILVDYKIFILISSLVGDTLILLASLQSNAFKLHVLMVALIQHAAVADLLLCLFSIVPCVVSLVVDGWVLGDMVCYFNYFLNASASAAVSIFASTGALFKMLIVISPLRAMHYSCKTGHITAAAIWLLCSIFPTAALAKDKTSLNFSYLTYTCDYSGDWKPTEAGVYIATVSFTILVCPTIVTVVSSVVVLVVARRAARRLSEGLQWQGVMAILLTAAAHTLIALPLTTVYLYRAITGTPLSPGSAFLHAYRYAWFFSSLMLIVNFYIFALTLPSFRVYLGSRARLLFETLKRLCHVGEPQPGLANERTRLLQGA